MSGVLCIVGVPDVASWLVGLYRMHVHTVQAPARYLLVCHALVSWTSVQCLLSTGF